MNESARLEALASYDILDTMPETPFNGLAVLAAQLCDTPVATVTFVDEQRQWFKAAVGLSIRETARAVACCAYTIEQTGVFIVPDTLADPRFTSSPLVVEEPHVRFYAGVPLISSDGHAVGAIAVMDVKPRDLSAKQSDALKSLANLAVAQLELRRNTRELTRTADEMAQTAERLRAALEAKARIMDSSLDVICTIDERGEFCEVGAACLRVWGYEPEELVGRMFIDFVHPADRERSLQAGIEMMNGKGLSDFQNRYIRKDGAEVWMTWSFIWGDADRLFYCVGRDETARKRAEDTLRASEERFRQLLDAIPQALWVARPDGSIEYVNSRGLQFTGLQAEALMGMNWMGVLHPDDIGRTVEAWENCNQNHQAVEIEYRMRRADGVFRWALMQALPIKDGAGTILTWVGTCTDIDEQKRYKDRIREQAALLDNAHDAILSKGTEGEILYWNKGAEQMFGWSAEEVLGKRAEDFLYKDLDELFRARQSLFLNGKWSGELVKLTKDGRELIIQCSWTLLYDDDGTPKSLLAINTDVTGQHAIQEALKTSEERFRLLAQVTNDVVWDWDLMTDALWWNDGFFSVFGFGRDEVGMNITSWIERIHNEDRERIVNDVHQSIDSGESRWTGEYRFRRKDGSYAYVLDRGYVIRDRAGKPVRMIGGMADLTERRMTESRLEEQAMLLEMAKDSIIAQLPDGAVSYWNQGAERTYGYTAREMVGREFRLYPEHAFGAHAKAMRTVLETGEWHGELQHLCKDGREVTVECRWTCIFDAGRRPKMILCINTDVTERKKLEVQFLRAQRMESIGTLAGGIAHDLNNVLAPILMSAEMLRMGRPDPGDLELLETILTSAQRGASMVQQVLSFARGVEGERGNVEVKELLLQVAKIAEDTFPKSIQICRSFAADLLSISADATQLHQVLLNLCVNARDAMPNGGTLTLTAKNEIFDEHYASMELEAQAGPYVTIEVRDSGTGIPREIIEKIFDPFFTTKEVGKGTGLGLATSLAIVKSHGGFLRVNSDLGKGTTFRVYLPARPGAEKSMAEEKGPELPRGNGELILVVDDEEPIRRITSKTIERFGYRVMLAADGAEALAIYAKMGSEIAVVLTDIMMPILDGASLARALLRLNPNVRIIAASGLSSNGDIAKATGAGVKHFLPKPYLADTLMKLLAELLR